MKQYIAQPPGWVVPAKSWHILLLPHFKDTLSKTLSDKEKLDLVYTAFFIKNKTNLLTIVKDKIK